MDLNINFQLKTYSGSGSQDLKITSGPQKSELKMRIPAANGQTNWSTFGHVTIVTISGPKVRAQNGAVWCKRSKKLVNFSVMSRS